jgi:MFS family permease
MALRPSGFRRENSIIGLLVGLSVVGYILTGNEAYMTLSATLFWVSMFLFAGRKVEVENGKIILRWGWPVAVIREEISLDEVVDVLSVSDARRLRLVRYFRELIILSALWVFIGVLGLYSGPEGWGPYFWAAWIFWGLYPLLTFCLTPVSKRILTVLTLLLAVSLGAIIALLGQPEWGEYMVTVGIIIAALTYEDVLTPKGVLLLTERGSYLLTTSYEEDVEEFMKRLGTALPQREVSRNVAE